MKSECVHCGRCFKALKDHKCPVLKMVGLSPSDLVINTTENNCQQCDGCRKHYFLSNDLRQFRRYKKVELCLDCYNVPQIEEATSSHVLLHLRMMDIKMNRMTCSICAMHMGLIDSHSCCEIAGFKRDYVDVFCTEDTMWDMVQNGSTWDVIRAAHEKTRNVCLQCFSAISL